MSAIVDVIARGSSILVEIPPSRPMSCSGRVSWVVPQCLPVRRPVRGKQSGCVTAMPRAISARVSCRPSREHQYGNLRRLVGLDAEEQAFIDRT